MDTVDNLAAMLLTLAVKEAETMSPCKETKESLKKYASPSRRAPHIDANECLGLGPKKGKDETMWVAKQTKTKKKDGTFVVKWVQEKNKGAAVVATKKKKKVSPPRSTRKLVAQVGVPATRFKVSKDEDGEPKMLGEPGKEGVTLLVTMNDDGTEAAMKTFKPDKSVANIQKEAELQQDAADAGISPRVIEVQTTTTPKYILMEKLKERLVDRYTKGSTLIDKHQTQLIAMMDKLDEIKILHNDVNVLNLMLDDKDDLKLIDFGMARKLTAKDFKLGNSNGGITLAGMNRSLKRKRIYSGDKVQEYIEKKIKERQSKR